MKQQRRIRQKPRKTARRTKSGTGTLDFHTNFDAEAAKLAQWLAEHPVELDYVRLIDDKANRESRKGSVPMPKDELALLSKVFFPENSAPNGAVVAQGLRKAKLSFSEYGAAAHTDAGQFLHFTSQIADSWFQIHASPTLTSKFLTEFAEWISSKALVNDSQFFLTIAMLLERRSAPTAS